MSCSVRSSLKVSTLALMSALALPLPGLASETTPKKLDLLENMDQMEQRPTQRYPAQGSQQREAEQVLQELSQNLWREKQHLSHLILEVVQGEPNEAERAQRCLKAFLDDAAFPEDLAAFKPKLMSLCQRLLQPEALILKDKKDYLISDPNPTRDHDALKALRQILKDLEELIPAVPSSLQTPLNTVRLHYENYLNRLLTPGADRPVLLHPKAMLSGEGLFEVQEENIRSYRISQDMALALLSKDRYGLFLKSNKEGSHAVCQKGSVYFKGDTTTTGLRVGLEFASYVLSQVLFGRGMAPTALLTLNEVKIRTPSEGSPARGDFAKACAEGLTSAAFFQHYPHYQDNFTELPPHHLLQASQEVRGLSLETFLEKGISFQTLCRDSFSEQIILSLLLNPSDGTPGNFMVHQEVGKPDKIVGIDNDMAFGPSIVQTRVKGGFRHSPEVKNILYCLPLMAEPISDAVRTHLLSLSPEQAVFQWLMSLQRQEKRYQQFLTSSYQKGDQSIPYLSASFYTHNLHLPLKFAPDFISGMIERLKQIQQRLEGRPATTLSQLFHLIDPLAARFYQALQEGSNSILEAFQKIHNSNRENLFLEEVLAAQMTDRLPSGQTVAQALEAEISSADVTGNLTQTIDEERIILLSQIDLGQQTRLLPFLEQVATMNLSDQDLQALHPSWHQEGLLLRALQEKVSLQGIKFLLNLGLDVRFRHPETQQTVFHIAAQGHHPRALFERLLQDLSTDDRQALLNSKDNSHRTPLDEALIHKIPTSFIDLIHIGATACSPSLASKFYQRLIQQLSPSAQLEAAFKQLMTLNEEVEWQITLEELLPPLKGKKNPSEMTIYLSSYGERRLPQSIKDQVLDSRGHFIPFAGHGNHLVACAQGQGALKLHHLYFKVYPALPGLEAASGSLTHQLLGFGAPYTDLARIGSYPVLISQGIPGLTLLKVFQDGPEIMKDLVDEDISGLIITALLINPEDGKPDNYILTPHPLQQDKYRLVGIDNDQAFVPALVKEQPHKKAFSGKPLAIAQVKTVLYCLDQMKQPVAPSLRKRLINLLPDQFLQKWLRTLNHMNQSHSGLFTASEQARAFKDHECFIGVTFQKGAIAHLYEKLIEIKNLLTAFPHMSHINLLTKLEPRLAKRYQAALAKDLSPWQRFQEVDRPFYEVKKDGSHTTITKSGMILQSAGIPPQEKLLDLIRLGHENSPVQALQELSRIIQEKSHQTLEGLAARVGDLKLLQTLSLEESRAAFLKQLIQHHKVLSPQEQTAVLQYLTQQKRVREFLVPRFHVLTDEYFNQPLWLEHLRQVDLRQCSQVTNATLMSLAQGAPSLELLNLGSLSQLTVVGNLGFFNKDLLIFPSLHTLNMSQCTALTELLIQASQLTWLDVSGCHKLTPKGLERLIEHSLLLNTLKSDTGLNKLVNNKPIKTIVSGFYDNHSYPQISLALYGHAVYTYRTPVVIDLKMVKNQDKTFQFWIMPENKRFIEVSLSLQPHYCYAKTAIFFFDASNPDPDLSLSIFKHHYNHSNADQNISNFIDLTILLGVGNGFMGNLEEIEDFRQRVQIKQTLYLPWAKKPYQQKFMKDKLYALILREDEKLEQIDKKYNEHLEQERNFIRKFVKNIQKNSYSVVDLLEMFENFDYSNVIDQAQEITKNLNSVVLGSENSSQHILINNFKHLFYMGIIEDNQKIRNFFKDLSWLNIINQKIEIEDLKIFINPKFDLWPSEVSIEATLFNACSTGYLPAIKWLVQKNPAALREEINKATAIRYAIKYGHLAVIQWLDDENYLSLSMKNSILCQAAYEGQNEIVSYIISQGINVIYRIENYCKITPLHDAARNGHKEIALYLLEKGAKINFKNSWGQTALYLAAENGHKDLCWLLIEKGAKTICLIKDRQKSEMINIVEKFLR